MNANKKLLNAPFVAEAARGRWQIRGDHKGMNLLPYSSCEHESFARTHMTDVFLFVCWHPLIFLPFHSDSSGILSEVAFEVLQLTTALPCPGFR